MQKVVKVAKIGKRADSTDPNDFIFHSSYNTFKIIREGTVTSTLNASTSNQILHQVHGFDFIPLVAAFAKRSGVAQVFLPNAKDVESWGARAGMSGDVTFNYVASDVSKVIFSFTNAKTSEVIISIRYFLLEKID